MASLLQRAKRSRNAADSSSRFDSDDTSSLPEQERREILSEIDRIAADNKIMVTPQTFDFRARRGGARFPILVNVIAMALLAAGVYAMLHLYRQEDQSVRAGGGIAVATESRLIGELRRQTEQQLQQKEQQISEIRAQLAAVQSERGEIEAGIEERVRVLEAELRIQLDEEIEAERQRLISEGLSEAEIERLLRDFERRRLAELRAQVEAYRAELQREQQENARALALLEVELSRSLDETRRERSSLLEDARRRETELRTRYEERIARQSEQVAAAQQQLAELEQQREREIQLQRQITGYYDRIRSAIAASDYAEASQTIAQFRTYLDQDNIRALPMMQSRRQAELYALESLARLVEPQLETQHRSADDLLQRAQLLGEITQLLQASEAARQDGNAAAAEEFADEALALLPHGSRTRQFLAARDQLRAEKLQRALLSSRVAEADQALAAGSPQRAVDLYEQALIEATGIPQSVAAIVSRIAGGIEALVEQELSAQFNRELAQMESRTRSEVEALMQARLAELNSEHQRQTADYRRRIDELEQQLAAADHSRDQALSQRDEPSAADPALLAELDRLRRLEAELEELRASYQRFRQTEDRVVGATEDPFALIEGKLLLDSFLASEDVQALFPDLAERIRRYDRAFQATGRRAALLDTVEVVYTLSGYQDDAARRSYLQQERSRTSDPQLVEFLDELFSLVSNS
ncbi:MAG: hypothetical protein EA404_13690 [Spirochaetaceae bacterium]|nr:MAG: hypothetical protein EA404_13690 [Spirochaetaceae bacterium]